MRIEERKERIEKIVAQERGKWDFAEAELSLAWR
jgi:hypothetical protein